MTREDVGAVEPIHTENAVFRILALDGGGAKGFYTLGVLREIEAMLDCALCDRFDLVFGTSTGAITASLIALGYGVDEIHDLYRSHVPAIMSRRDARGKTAAFLHLANVVYGDRMFVEFKTGIGIVTLATPGYNNLRFSTCDVAYGDSDSKSRLRPPCDSAQTSPHECGMCNCCHVCNGAWTNRGVL